MSPAVLLSLPGIFFPPFIIEHERFQTLPVRKEWKRSLRFSNVEGYAKLFCVLVSEIFVNEYFTSFEIDSIYLLLLNVSLMCILLRNVKHHVTRRTLHYTDDEPELLSHF